MRGNRTVGRAIIDYGPVLLAWSAAFYRLPELWHRRDAGLQAVVLTLACIACALTVALPPVYAAIDWAVGIPNVAKLVVYGLGALVAWNVQKYFLYLANSPEKARQLVRQNRRVLLLALALMSILFVLAPVGKSEPVSFTARYGDEAAVLGFELVLLAYMLWAMCSTITQPWRYARLVAHKPATQLGMRLVAMGTATGVVYTVQRGTHLVSLALEFSYPIGDPELLGDALKSVFIAFCVIGATIPAWGPSLGVPLLCRWVCWYRMCLRLYPLWRDLYRVRPEIALLPPKAPLIEMLDPRNLRFRLYRRVIEIRDAWVALRPYMDPAVTVYTWECCKELRLSESDLRATIDAASLAVAIQFRAVNPRSSSRLFQRSQVSPSDVGLHREIAHLEKVAACYKDSPIVREVLAHFVTTTHKERQFAL